MSHGHCIVLLHACIHSLFIHFCAANDAKCWFIKLWSSSHLFGMEFFSCINTEIKEKGLVGISKEKVRELTLAVILLCHIQILFLHLNNKKKNKVWEFGSLSYTDQVSHNRVT